MKLVTVQAATENHLVRTSIENIIGKAGLILYVNFLPNGSNYQTGRKNLPSHYEPLIFYKKKQER
jgi:hypothetical protein